MQHEDILGADRHDESGAEGETVGEGSGIRRGQMPAAVVAQSFGLGQFILLNPMKLSLTLCWITRPLPLLQP